MEYGNSTSHSTCYYYYYYANKDKSLQLVKTFKLSKIRLGWEAGDKDRSINYFGDKKMNSKTINCQHSPVTSFDNEGCFI